MRRKSYVKKDSFWGDFLNLLTMRPIYRKPNQSNFHMPEMFFISYADSDGVHHLNAFTNKDSANRAAEEISKEFPGTILVRSYMAPCSVDDFTKFYNSLWPKDAKEVSPKFNDKDMKEAIKEK